MIPFTKVYMWLIFSIILLLLSFTDIKKRLIPNRLLLLAALNRMVWLFLLKEPLLQTLQTMRSSLIIPIALLLFVLVYEHFKKRRAMGMGDIKLLLIMALYFNWQKLLLTLFTACLLAVFGAYFTGKNKEEGISFGPFLAAGCVFAAAFGEAVIGWYRGFG